MKKVKPRNSSPIRIRGRGRSNNKPKGTMIFRLNHIIFFVPTLYNPRSTKGQLILKADWRAIDSAKKQTDEFVFFSFLLFTAKKSNSSIRFLGESTERQSAFRFYLTFMVCHVMGFSYGDSLWGSLMVIFNCTLSAQPIPFQLLLWIFLMGISYEYL